MITVEIWSDVVCPWCYIGKRRFERALEGFQGDLTIVWRSFQLDPDAPASEDRGLVESFAARKGLAESQVRAMFAQVTEVAAGDGLAYDFDRVRATNTYDAHRLLHFAKANGRQGELKERLFRAYFTEGEQLGDVDVLARLAGEAGLDAAEARKALDTGGYADDVRDDILTAQALGITGVPFFVFNRRFAVSGAQPVEVFTRALEAAASEASAVDASDAAAPACDDDSCAV